MLGTTDRLKQVLCLSKAAMGAPVPVATMRPVTAVGVCDVKPQANAAAPISMCLATVLEDLPHPDCSDTQLTILEGVDKTFSAVNYIKISGAFRFLCWPLKHEHLQKIDSNTHAECNAAEFDKIIFQRVQMYRGGLGDTTSDDEAPCVTVEGEVRDDGTIVFSVDLSQVGVGENDRSLAARVAQTIKSAIQNQKDKLQEELNVAKETVKKLFDSYGVGTFGFENIVQAAKDDDQKVQSILKGAIAEIGQQVQSLSMTLNMSDTNLNANAGKLDTYLTALKQIDKIVKDALESEFKRFDSESAKLYTTLDNAAESMEFSLDSSSDSLNQLLSTIVMCVKAGMSMVVGLYPENLDSGAFKLTFKNLQLNPDKTLEVPCLGLIHEDTTAPQPKGDRVLFEHSNAVRSSYWVCALADRAQFDVVEIQHSNGEHFLNDFDPYNPGYLKKSSQSYGAGVSQIAMPKSNVISDLVNDAEHDGHRTARQNASKKVVERLTSLQAASMWPNNTVPDTQFKPQVTNIALARVGTTPVASITLAYRNKDFAWMSRHAQEVRVNLDQLLSEKKWAEKPNAPPPRPSFRGSNFFEFAMANPTPPDTPHYRVPDWQIGGDGNPEKRQRS